jgi:ribonucleotide reductase alpha subunit
MKITKIVDNTELKHTWDIEVPNTHEYILENGVVSHNTSSDYSNSTSGIDMPRDLIVTKKSKVGNFKQIVPNFSKGSQYYTLATEIDNLLYLKMLSKFQLYIDQAISTNVYWTERDYIMDSNGKPKFPMKKMVKSITYAHKVGLKTTYYSTFVSTEDELAEVVDAGCESGGCSV